ncbi:MAG: hypothetical protein ABL993_08520 [Vicinamibacterales bacterium]
MTLRPSFGGSTAGLIVGILLMLSSGLDTTSAGRARAIGGLVAVIGSLIYRSAKRTTLGVARPSVIRRAMEGLGVIAVIAIIGLQPDVLYFIREDPVPNLVIPLWGLIAFLCAKVGSAEPKSSPQLEESS